LIGPEFGHLLVKITGIGKEQGNQKTEYGNITIISLGLPGKRKSLDINQADSRYHGNLNQHTR